MFFCSSPVGSERQSKHTNSPPRPTGESLESNLEWGPRDDLNDISSPDQNYQNHLRFILTPDLSMQFAN